MWKLCVAWLAVASALGCADSRRKKRKAPPKEKADSGMTPARATKPDGAQARKPAVPALKRATYLYVHTQGKWSWHWRPAGQRAVKIRATIGPKAEALRLEIGPLKLGPYPFNTAHGGCLTLLPRKGHLDISFGRIDATRMPMWIDAVRLKAMPGKNPTVVKRYKRRTRQPVPQWVPIAPEGCATKS